MADGKGRDSKLTPEEIVARIKLTRSGEVKPKPRPDLAAEVIAVALDGATAGADLPFGIRWTIGEFAEHRYYRIYRRTHVDYPWPNGTNESVRQLMRLCILTVPEWRGWFDEYDMIVPFRSPGWIGFGMVSAGYELIAGGGPADGKVALHLHFIGNSRTRRRTGSSDGDNTHKRINGHLAFAFAAAAVRFFRFCAPVMRRLAFAVWGFASHTGS